MSATEPRPWARASATTAASASDSLGHRPNDQSPSLPSATRPGVGSLRARWRRPTSSATSFTAAVAAGVVQHTTAQAPASASWRARSAARCGEPASSRTSTTTWTPKTPPPARDSRAHPEAASDCDAPASRASPEREAMTPIVTPGAGAWAPETAVTRARIRLRTRGTASLLTAAGVSAVRGAASRTPPRPGAVARARRMGPTRVAPAWLVARRGWLVRPTGFEPVTLGLGVPCSVQLSYGRTHRTRPDEGRVPWYQRQRAVSEYPATPLG